MKPNLTRIGINQKVVIHFLKTRPTSRLTVWLNWATNESYRVIKDEYDNDFLRLNITIVQSLIDRHIIVEDGSYRPSVDVDVSYYKLNPLI